MNETVKTETVGPLTVRVVWDDSGACDPRDWDNLGVMMCAHRNYRLGDVQGTEEDIPEDAVHVMPVYLFDHSGLSVSTDAESFRRWDAAGWDWGQLGVIYTTPARVEAIGTPEDRIEDVLRDEVKTYDDYLRGNVYGFVVEDDAGEHVDSCWGYIGEPDYALSEGLEVAKCSDAYRRWESLTAVQLAGIGL